MLFSLHNIYNELATVPDDYDPRVNRHMGEALHALSEMRRLLRQRQERAANRRRSDATDGNF